MLFNSYTFALFFIVVFILFWLPVRKRRREWQNIVILVASYVFYGWWDWRFLFLIALTSLTSWLSGMLISRNVRPRIVSAANIIINIGILACFKYFNFFIDSFISLFSLFGINMGSGTLDIILPVGISFYTFQALSYSIDVYRGRIRACSDPVRFFAFVSFFPALVAGPIERAQNLLPQFDLPKDKLDYDKAIVGVFRVVYGLFLKIVIADRLAVYVNGAWGHLDTLSWFPAVVAMVFFAFQLYLDFSAYSEIAKGIAALLGFEVMTNFRRPYLSATFKEFWKRWHISLSSWFMDYVYIPLGGSRRGEPRRWVNLMTVFLLSGLWHGASWNFVLWGALNGIFVLSLDPLLRRMRHLGPLVVFICWTASLVLFRSPGNVETSGFLSGLFTSGEIHSVFTYGLGKSELLFAACLVAALVVWEHIAERYGERLKKKIVSGPSIVRYVLLTMVILLIIIFGRYGIGNDSAFIYFQF